MNLWPFQFDAVESVFREWETNTSTLGVCFTGGGKTRIACEVIRRMHPKKSVFLAHTEELVFQAKARIEHFTGLSVDIEMGSFSATGGAFGGDVLVASVQTQNSKKGGGRILKFNPMEYGCVIADEAHHFCAQSFRRPMDHYKTNPDLKILGLTATPDRHDEQALGKIFDSVAFNYDIEYGIREGWLVDILQKSIVTSVDFSHIRTTAGELNGAELSAVMTSEKNVQAFIQPTLEAMAGLKDQTLLSVPVETWTEFLMAQPMLRKGIVFCVSKVHAEMACNIFNRILPNMAAFVCDETPKDERRDIKKRFTNGDLKLLCNVNIFTEGFDDPATELIVNAAPTLSRSKYAQRVGRGTRVLPGLIDDLHSSFERKDAIASSPKEFVTVLDFVGSAGKHKLISSADLLGGDYSDEAIDSARRKAKESKDPVRMSELLAQSEKEIRERMEASKRAEEARKMKLVAKVQYTSKIINPFDAFDLSPVRERGWDNGKTLSLKQRDILIKVGVNPDEIGFAQGRQLVAEQCRRWSKDLCSVKQESILKKRGIVAKDLTRKEASRMIDEIAIKEGWKKEPVTA